MAYYVNSFTSAAKKAQKQVTSIDVANSLFGQDMTDDAKSNAQHHISVSAEKGTAHHRNYLFRFAGSWSIKNPTVGHWSVLIYHKSEAKRQTPRGTRMHQTRAGVQIEENQEMKANQYKAHPIANRSYADILAWAHAYRRNSSQFSKSDANCRKFAIRLAEYCSVSIFEIDGQVTMGIPVSSQYYTLQDTKCDVVSAAKDVSQGKVVTAAAKTGKSVMKNTAKIGVATGSTIAATGGSLLGGAKSLFF